eukprot:12578416-Alexandrium_andersonii.AAC.1
MSATICIGEPTAGRASDVDVPDQGLEDLTERLCLATLNVTALRPNAGRVMEMLVGDQARATCVAVQEHTLPQGSEVGIRKLANRSKCRFIAGPGDPSSARPAA